MVDGRIRADAVQLVIKSGRREEDLEKLKAEMMRALGREIHNRHGGWHPRVAPEYIYMHLTVNLHSTAALIRTVVKSKEENIKAGNRGWTVDYDGRYS